MREFEEMPKWLELQKCQAVSRGASVNDCEFHNRKWRAHLDSIRADTGIPKGLRISIGGNLRIIAETGGSITFEYETFRLHKDEAFLIIIDHKQVHSVFAGTELKDGLSVQKVDSFTYDLSKGDHLIQLSVESRREPEVVRSYSDTLSNNMEDETDGIDSVA